MAVYGTTNPTPEERETQAVKRYGSVIGLLAEREDEYRELHANACPEVTAQLKKSHIQNYSIYVAELAGQKYLFSYFEYTGDDFKNDMRTIAEHPATKRWWQKTAPCQEPLPDRQPEAQWSELEMVFLLP